jgi:hypothetical protein
VIAPAAVEHTGQLTLDLVAVEKLDLSKLVEQNVALRSAPSQKTEGASTIMTHRVLKFSLPRGKSYPPNDPSPTCKKALIPKTNLRENCSACGSRIIPRPQHPNVTKEVHPCTPMVDWVDFGD